MMHRFMAGTFATYIESALGALLRRAIAVISHKDEPVVLRDWSQHVRMPRWENLLEKFDLYSVKGCPRANPFRAHLSVCAVVGKQLLRREQEIFAAE